MIGLGSDKNEFSKRIGQGYCLLEPLYSKNRLALVAGAQGRCRWSMLTWFLGSSLRHRTAFYLPLFPDQNTKVKEWRRRTLQFQSTSVPDLGSAVIVVDAYSDNVAGFRPLPLFQLSIIPPSKPAFQSLRPHIERARFVLWPRPKGWVHITSSNTSLDQISISKSWLRINFKVSTKHQYLD